MSLFSLYWLLYFHYVYAQKHLLNKWTNDNLESEKMVQAWFCEECDWEGPQKRCWEAWRVPEERAMHSRAESPQWEKEGF